LVFEKKTGSLNKHTIRKAQLSRLYQLPGALAAGHLSASGASINYTAAGSPVFKQSLQDRACGGRLGKKLDSHNAQEGRPYKIALSIGISYYDPQNPCTIEELLAEADRNMYEQKRDKQENKIM
jgi:GGDEF domain-containing protein